MQKLLFVATHYGLLGVCGVACWGLGRKLLRWSAVDITLRAGSITPVALALGMGVAICALQGMAIAGQLRAMPILGLLALGMVAGATEIPRLWRARAMPDILGAWRGLSFYERCATVCVLLFTLQTVLLPVRPPLEWDELMYHLPHAQQWALSGRLQVNEWLRYPWFPYDFDLLYAASLVFGNDILPHLFEAAAGWLTAWLIFQLGLQHINRIGACLAASIWLVLSKDDYARAYVDLGVTLFVFAACFAFLQWHGSRLRAWLAIGAFFLGLAAGTKYQGLAALPFFAAVLLWRDRRPASWALAMVAFALPCGYWYVRNAVMTGDPFNPIGGRLFGFTDWNLSDYQNQFNDLRRNAGLPSLWLWPALLAPLWPGLRARPAVRGAVLFSAYMVAVWALSSRYPRYLMPAYPVLVLLAAAFWVEAWGQLHARTNAIALSVKTRWVALLVVIGLSVGLAMVGAKQWTRLAGTDTQRQALLQSKVPGYDLWVYVKAHPQRKIYQFQLEDSLYYAPQPVWGEIFGPWRYDDYTKLAPAQLHRRFSDEGFSAVAIHSERNPAVTSQAGFDHYFAEIFASGPVKLYTLRPNPTPTP